MRLHRADAAHGATRRAATRPDGADRAAGDAGRAGATADIGPAASRHPCTIGAMRRAPSTTAIQGGPDTVRFSWLLAALVTAFALPPLLEGLHFSLAGLRLGLAGVLVASLYAVSRRRSVLWIGLALAGTTLGFDAAGVAVTSRGLAIAAELPAIAFLGLIVFTLGRALLAADHVTTDTILGGICVYLLLGMLWTSAYSLVETAKPGSLLVGGVPFSQLAATRSDVFRGADLFYFSFVTLTTLGYGDVTPASGTARALATGEAVIGQLYVAIFVARLVGLHLAESRSTSSD